MKIRLNNIRLFAFHGVLAEEQSIGAWFRVSLCAEVPNLSGIDTDDIKGTINYAELANIVKEEMNITSSLIEHVAGRIGRRIMSEIATIQSLSVTVYKENPPICMECESASVELTWERDTFC